MDDTHGIATAAVIDREKKRNVASAKLDKLSVMLVCPQWAHAAGLPGSPID